MIPKRVQPAILKSSFSGKIYYDLLKQRQDLEQEGIGRKVRLIRVEQFYPFPKEQIEAIITKYETGQAVWVQEETENRGGYHFMWRQFDRCFNGLKLSYIGRPESASPATGSYKKHLLEQKQIIERVFE